MACIVLMAFIGDRGHERAVQADFEPMQRPERNFIKFEV